MRFHDLFKNINRKVFEERKTGGGRQQERVLGERETEGGDNERELWRRERYKGDTE